MKFFLNIIFIGLLFVSCGKYNDEEIKAFDNTIKKYINKNNLQMNKSESGLYYKIHESGEGEPIKGTAVISAVYTGKLLNGEVFDEQKEPTELKLNNLIHGWREVAYYLKPGGKATIIVPPQIGYGQQKLGKIPESSILMFDIEIIDVY